MASLNLEQIKKLDEMTEWFNRGLKDSSWTSEFLAEMASDEMQKQFDQVRAKNEEDWSILANMIVGREIAHTE